MGGFFAGSVRSTVEWPSAATTVASNGDSHGSCGSPGRHSHSVFECGRVVVEDAVGPDDWLAGEWFGAELCDDELEQAVAATTIANASTRVDIFTLGAVRRSVTKG